MSQFPIGIDLGTTYSAITVYRNGFAEIIPNDQGNRLTPSVVAFNEEECLIGEGAHYQAPINSENTIFAVKRLMGQDFHSDSVQQDIKNWPYKVIKKDNKIYIQVKYKGETRYYLPEQISAMILGRLKESAETFLDQEVTEAVITVPAYFNDAQRTATRDAAEIAGLKPLKIINEPTAAALAFGNRGVKKQTALIFDFGGGTFDITIVDIVDQQYTVKGTNGDPHLGGEDIDQRLVDHFKEELKHDPNFRDAMFLKLKQECEKVKRTLSSSQEATLNLNHNLTRKITRARFEELCYDLFEKSIRLVDEALIGAKLSKSQIDNIILVGGTTRIPKVRKMLSEFFGGKKLNHTVNPDEAVAIGAAYQAALFSNVKYTLGLKGIKLLDVCPLSLGIEVKDGSLSKIINRNTPIPVKRTERYVTTKDNQSSVTLAVYEGERVIAKQNHFLGQFTLNGIPPAPKGEGTIHCSFEIDDDGILTVYAFEPTTGNRNQIVITNDSRLSRQAAKKMVMQAQEIRNDEKKIKERLAALHRFEEKLIGAGREAGEFAGEIRSKIEKKVEQFKAWFEKNRNTANVSKLESKSSELQKYVDVCKGSKVLVE